MKKIISLWDEKEVISLFRFIEDKKNKNLALISAFKEYAILNGRKQNSVRNYYYSELKNLETDSKRAKHLGIDVSLHIKCDQKEFTEKETKDIIDEITKLKNLGYSIRKACMKLANGDVKQMIRFQNKYRSILRQSPEMLTAAKNKLSEKGIMIEKENVSNILEFKKTQKRLLDSEISSLFMGLVKLVKKNALEQASDDLKKEVEYANDTLRRTLVSLNEKEVELNYFRKQMKIFTTENINLKSELVELRTKNAENLQKNHKKSKKMSELNRFMDNFVKTPQVDEK